MRFRLPALRRRRLPAPEIARRMAAWDGLASTPQQRPGGVLVLEARPVWARPGFADHLVAHGASSRLVAAARRSARPRFIPEPPTPKDAQ